MRGTVETDAGVRVVELLFTQIYFFDVPNHDTRTRSTCYAGVFARTNSHNSKNTLTFPIVPVCDRRIPLVHRLPPSPTSIIDTMSSTKRTPAEASYCVIEEIDESTFVDTHGDDDDDVDVDTERRDAGGASARSTPMSASSPPPTPPPQSSSHDQQQQRRDDRDDGQPRAHNAVSMILRDKRAMEILSDLVATLERIKYEDRPSGARVFKTQWGRNLFNLSLSASMRQKFNIEEWFQIISNQSSGTSHQGVNGTMDPSLYCAHINTDWVIPLMHIEQMEPGFVSSLHGAIMLEIDSHKKMYDQSKLGNSSTTFGINEGQPMPYGFLTQR